MYDWFLSKATRISMWVFLFNFERMETAIVKRAFTCVNSRRHYKVGDEYKSDADRIKYLSDKGYVAIATITAHVPKAEVPAPSKAEVTEPTTKPKRKRNESK